MIQLWRLLVINLFHVNKQNKFFDMGLSRPHFSLFSSVQQLTVCSCLKFCQWLDLNSRTPVSEATALPTEPQPLPNNNKFLCCDKMCLKWGAEVMKRIYMPDLTIDLNCGKFLWNLTKEAVVGTNLLTLHTIDRIWTLIFCCRNRLLTKSVATSDPID